MSLKGFHIVFVTICTVLSAFLATWGFVLSGETSALSTGMATVGTIGLLLMPIYGVYFYRKAAKLVL